MSSVPFGTGPGTSSLTSWLKTYVNWQRGLSSVSSCFHKLPVTALFITSMKLLGTALAHQTRALFIVLSYDFLEKTSFTKSAGVFQSKRLSYILLPFNVHKRGMYYKQISSPSFASAGITWHDMKQLERGSKNYCISQKYIQPCCGVPAPKRTKSISLTLSFLEL